MSSGGSNAVVVGSEMLPEKKKDRIRDAKKDKKKEKSEVGGKYCRSPDSDEAVQKKAKVDEVEEISCNVSEVGSLDERNSSCSVADDVGVISGKAGLSDAVAAGFGFKTKTVVEEGSSVLGRMRGVAAKMLDVVMNDDVPSHFARVVLETSGCYEEIIANLVAENERLRGKLEVYEKIGVASAKPTLPERVSVASVLPSSGAMPPAVQPISIKPTPVAPKPVETWSVVVKGKKGATSKEVMDKVVTEVGPTLGVRVHEMRPIKAGGAVIRTPSVAEREKLATNTKFSEVGLEVSVNDKLGPKVVVQRVHAEISPDEFMEELYSWNFKSTMTLEEYRKKVRLVTAPWKPDGNGVNVVLEGSSEAMQLLLDNGRCYIKWFSFFVRVQDAVPSCYRCLSFDHMVRECKMKDGICRFCGETGHLASRCVNAVKCRNCAFKRQPADHLMMSAS